MKGNFRVVSTDAQEFFEKKKIAGNNLLSIIAFSSFQIIFLSYIIGQYYYKMAGLSAPKPVDLYILPFLLIAIVSMEFSNRIKSDFFRNMSMVMNVFIINPLICYYYYSPNNALFWNIFGIFLVMQLSGYYTLSFLNIREKISTSFLFIFSILSVSLLVITLIGGVNIGFFIDIRSVYLFRQTNDTSLTIIIFGLITNCFIPLFIILTFKSRPFAVTIISTISALLLFSATGHKIVIASTLLLLSYFIFKARTTMVLFVPAIVIIIISLVTIGTEYRIFSSLLVRRSFLVQPYLFEIWYDVFNGGPIAMWGTIFPLNIFGYYPFNAPMVLIVGKITGGWPNTSILMDTLANAGIFAMPVMAIFCFFMHIFIRFVPRDIHGVLGFFIGVIFINGSFFSVFMDPAFLILILLLIFLRANASRRRV